ncbi:hypothetical protein SHKM778_36250 [Streptomyces sp. KM77-8]|uniref:Secreted protein n=1 Tax=Streptomyces haneummycinicus TaxID=3074435 RepID=A0AAT9HIT3_9ACTN
MVTFLVLVTVGAGFGSAVTVAVAVAVVVVVTVGTGLAARAWAASTSSCADWVPPIAPRANTATQAAQSLLRLYSGRMWDGPCGWFCGITSLPASVSGGGRAAEAIAPS